MRRLTIWPPATRRQVTGDNYLTHDRGLWSWVFTLDHKRIGVMYLVGIMSSFLLGGIFALLIRAELFTPGKMFLSEDRYNEMFTLHGAIMTFLFIIPSIPAALGNFLLPLMLGAKDVAFPRLNLASFFLWVGGAIFFLMALAIGGLDTGWTFYTPYSTTTSGTVVAATVGAFILGFSSIFTGMNFVVTINTMRPPGMTWFKMPLFLWSLYATAIIQLLATPVLGITLVLLTAEKLFHIGIFDPKLGGDPVLYQHFFWFYSHPAVYIMILPAMGIISELVSVFSRKHIFGYRFIAYSSMAIAIFGFLVWGHHMFVSGQSRLAAITFSALTFSVSIPSAIKVFNWLATMYKGSINLAAPMCYALSFILLFGIGGLTGLFLGTLATDVHLHDTYFVVAHFHYVMMGGTLVAFLGGLHYWWPKMFGRMYNELWARIALPDHLPRFQPDVHAAVPAGHPRDAAALRPLFARISALAPDVHDRRLCPGRGAVPRRRSAAVRPGQGQAGGGESLGQPVAGVDLQFSAAAAQFRRDADGRRSLRLQRQPIQRGRRRLRGSQK